MVVTTALLLLLCCCYCWWWHGQVTKVKLEQKQKEGIAEARSGRRGPVSNILQMHSEKLCLPPPVLGISVCEAGQSPGSYSSQICHEHSV